MGKRQRSWAKAWKARLRASLGLKCNYCGSQHDLQLDCIKPRTNGHARREQSQRVTFYRREWMQGNLQLLCGRCNAIKGDLDPNDPAVLRLVNSVNKCVQHVPTEGTPL